MMKPRALACLAALGALLAAPAAARGAGEFGIAPGSLIAAAKNQDGTVDLQASSHPYSYTISFALNTSEGRSVGGELRDLLIGLPPGMSGNPFAVARCTRQEFEGGAPHCSPNSQVGVVRAFLPGIGALASGPIYDLVPPPGVAAQLGFSAAGLNALQSLSVRSEEGYGVLSSTNDVPEEVTFVEATIWGTPADESHDSQRGAAAAAGHGSGVGYVGAHLPFLALPASCAAPLETTVEVDSKLDPGHFVSATAYSLDSGGEAAPLRGCGAVPFSPQAFATPSASSASSPAGLGFRLGLANEGLLSPEGILETEPEKITVTLPEGIAGNPALANGLGSCSEAQFHAASASDPGCPEDSKLGTLVARSPLLEEPVQGALYLATPHRNPFGTLLAFYLVASAPDRGVVVKQAGRVDIDPSTGQVTTSFDGLPPLPYSSLELNLREGPRAPLMTPSLCGRYEASVSLYPFSEPATPVLRTVPFTIGQGPGGGACPASEAAMPNHPSFEAGTLTPLAGAYSPFVFKLSRADGDQPFGRVSATLPEGLVGKLAGVPYCPEAAIAAAAARSADGEGALEASSPSCPAASRIGTVDVAAGAGSQPVHVGGSVYLAGPYKGAPLSFVVVVPAIAGPFDLGTVVVRSALQVNEETAEITAVSDPLPQMLDGLPLAVRSLTVSVDREGFTLNPTSCAEKHVTGAETSALGQIAPLSARFQVGGCRGLRFKPRLAISLEGQTKRAGHPALKAVVTYPKEGEYANIARAQVGLPHALFLDNENLDKVCKQADLKAGTCPKGSVYGHAKAWTPLLEKPLEGPVYLGVGYGHKLPDLVADLNGQIRILLHGKVDTTKRDGIRNTFEAVPDAPVSKFVLEMKGGKHYSLIENHENLCAGAQRASALFTAQNGLTAHLTPKISVSCHRRKKH